MTEPGKRGPNRKPSVLPDLIAALKAGPVPSADWPTYCNSRHAFETNIYRLRKKGFVIDTVPGGGLPSSYHLRSEPALDPTDAGA